MTNSNDGAELPALKLKRGEDRRLRAGHLWVFSNEIDTRATPLTAFTPGEEAVLLNAVDKPVGTVYVNPKSLIAARVCTRDANVAIDQSLFVHRIKIALSLRDRLFKQPYYRLIFGESDGLPGLVVDRFDDVLVVQITTAGMESRRDQIVGALSKVLRPKGILMRNDVPVRQLEGLEQYVEVATGDVPAELIVEEAELKFAVNPHSGQKTGWFYDQRSNRDRLTQTMAGWLTEARTLDVYSYVGAWGLRMAAAGASDVTCVDISPQAIERIEQNATRNRLDDRIRTVQSDGLSFLKQAAAAQERFDVIVLDPPAFVKRKKDYKDGAIAYRRINETAMRLLSRDGLLISCSCSHHMPIERFVQTIQQAGRHVDRNVQILSQLQQGPDHPVHPAIPETSYLKGVIARVTPV